jgi:hypothetical protein
MMHRVRRAAVVIVAGSRESGFQSGHEAQCSGFAGFRP